MIKGERIVFLDWLRVIACFMVMLIHSTEPFYLGGEGTLITSEAHGVWATLIDSPLRAAVPLFLLTSSYLLFPIKGEMLPFLRHRFTRIGIPAVFWLAFFAFVPAIGSNLSEYSLMDNLKHVLLNFTDNGGHLWFVFMILGVYLLMPLLSPWIERVSKKEEELFLCLWLFTTLVPYFRQLAVAVFGLPEIWGEAKWNEFGMLYYVSGFIGYLVLGHYFKTYVPMLSWGKTLAWALPLWIVGYAIIAGGFWALMPKDYPVSGPYELAVRMETTWTYCSLGVAFTAIAYFLVARKFISNGAFYHRLIVPLSTLSFGIYLVHMYLLPRISTVLTSCFTTINEWVSTPCIIVCTAALTFIFSALIIKIISYLPGHRFIIG